MQETATRQGRKPSPVARGRNLRGLRRRFEEHRMLRTPEAGTDRSSAIHVETCAQVQGEPAHSHFTDPHRRRELLGRHGLLPRQEDRVHLQS